MGRKKINKKDAAVYHLVRRSQRDVGGYMDKEGQPIDMPSDFVLIPSNETLKRAEVNKKQQQEILAKKQLADNGDGDGDGDDDNAQDALMRAKKKLAAAN